MFDRLKKVVPDPLFLRLKFRRYMGKPLHLKNPETLNEKLQWLKLHNRNPEYTKMVDKYEAKSYVAERIGEQYIIPTYGVWDRFEDIDLDLLPDRFVLKCTHDSGKVVICQDKSRFDQVRAGEILNSALRRNYYWVSREWPYKNVKPRILAEEYLGGDESDLMDYKIWCFDGVPAMTLVCSNRFAESGLCEDFYDPDWNRLPLKRPDCGSASEPAPRPENYEEMWRLAGELARGIPFVRVDFYEMNGQVYFGELTFFPAEGMKAFIPEEWDVRLGNMVSLGARHRR